MNRALTATAVLLALLAGCSGSRAATTGASPGSPAAPTTAAATTTVVAQLLADQVVAGLAAKVATVQPSITYTAANDPNNLLGRPGGYTSKSSFTDSRIDPAKAQVSTVGSVDLGGSVEMFPTNAEAVQRGQYILRAITATGFVAHEYDFASGGALLRLAAGFTPDQAAAYASALAAVTGMPAPATG